MWDRLRVLLQRVRRGLRELGARLTAGAAGTGSELRTCVARTRLQLAVLGPLVACTYALCRHPPLTSVQRGQILVRTNLLDGSAQTYTAGTVVVLPGIHQLRRFPTRDQVFRPLDAASATGPRRSSRTRDSLSASTWRCAGPSTAAGSRRCRRNIPTI